MAGPLWEFTRCAFDECRDSARRPPTFEPSQSVNLDGWMNSVHTHHRRLLYYYIVHQLWRLKLCIITLSLNADTYFMILPSHASRNLCWRPAASVPQQKRRYDPPFRPFVPFAPSFPLHSHLSLPSHSLLSPPSSSCREAPPALKPSRESVSSSSKVRGRGNRPRRFWCIARGNKLFWE